MILSFSWCELSPLSFTTVTLDSNFLSSFVIQAARRNIQNYVRTASTLYNVPTKSERSFEGQNIWHFLKRLSNIGGMMKDSSFFMFLIILQFKGNCVKLIKDYTEHQLGALESSFDWKYWVCQVSGTRLPTRHVLSLEYLRKICYYVLFDWPRGEYCTFFSWKNYFSAQPLSDSSYNKLSA